MSEISSNNQISTSSDSSDTIAMILEIIFGLCGILGMGWLYAGNIAVAIMAFVGFLIVAMGEIFVASITLGLAGCIILPINLAVAVISGFRVRDYVRNTGAKGSVLYVIIGILVGMVVLCIGFFIFFGGLSALGNFGNY